MSEHTNPNTSISHSDANPLPSLAPGSAFEKQVCGVELKFPGPGYAAPGSSYYAASYFGSLQTRYKTAIEAGLSPENSPEELLRRLDHEILRSKLNFMTPTANAVVRYCVAYAEGLSALCDEWYD